MEPGTALAVVSLSFQVFGGCVKGFCLLSEAHNLGKDASFLRTLLNLEEYRFTQWANAVGLTSPAATMDPRLNQALANDLMGQLQELLSTGKLRERYGLELIVNVSESTVDTDSPNDTASTQGILGRAVSNALRAEILARARLIQSKNHFPKRLWWAMVDKTKFQSMVADVRALVDGLWALLDPLQRRDVVSLMESMLATIIQISGDIRGLQALEDNLDGSTTPSSSSRSSISAAAGLRVAGLQIGNDDADLVLTSSSDQNRSKGAADSDFNKSVGMKKKLTPLRMSLLTNYSSMSNTSEMGTGLYDGKPVLVEQKIVPPKLKGKLIARVQNLALLLSEPPSPSFATLRCLGFFEEGDDKFNFVFEYPQEAVNATSPTIFRQPLCLLSLLRDTTLGPSVTDRLNLTTAICRTVLSLHIAGWLHKNIRSDNILFFSDPKQENPSDVLKTPFLVGFTFSRYDSPDAISEQPSSKPSQDIYRHPEALGEPTTSFQKHMDIYSVGTVMAEIAQWRPLKRIVAKCVDLRDSQMDIPLTSIARIPNWLVVNEVENGAARFRLGDVFGEAISFCLCRWDSKDQRDTVAGLLVVVQKLERCSM